MGIVIKSNGVMSPTALTAGVQVTTTEAVDKSECCLLLQ